MNWVSLIIPQTVLVCICSVCCCLLLLFLLLYVCICYLNRFFDKYTFKINDRPLYCMYTVFNVNMILSSSCDATGKYAYVYRTFPKKHPLRKVKTLIKDIIWTKVVIQVITFYSHFRWVNYWFITLCLFFFFFSAQRNQNRKHSL